MIRCHIDHLVVTAPTLAVGAEYVHGVLGVMPEAGGEHERLGTHNRLLRLGDVIYLEVVAVKPRAPSPVRPRWFDLDRLDANAPPRLAAWVARTDDIEGAAAASPIPLGPIELMSRDDLHWLITLPEDGRQPLDGLAPALIQWSSPLHPARRLKNVGCSLNRLEAFHPEPPRLVDLLQCLGLEGDVIVSPVPAGQAPHLRADIRTPSGVHRLGGIPDSGGGSLQE
jgi:hypothetical protein